MECQLLSADPYLLRTHRCADAAQYQFQHHGKADHAFGRRRRRALLYDRFGRARSRRLSDRKIIPRNNGNEPFRGGLTGLDPSKISKPPKLRLATGEGVFSVRISQARTSTFMNSSNI